MTPNIIKHSIMIILLAGLAACQSSSSTSNFNNQVKQVNICSGFGCVYQQSLVFSASDMKHIQVVLGKKISSPKEERAAISKLIAWKEKLAQRRLHMRQDTKLSYQRDAGVRGQMDCVDESNNTLAFLRFLDSESRLKFHKPVRIGARGFLFDGRYPHKTAVVSDQNNTKWAIDSWKKDGGLPPQIVKYSKWKAERASEYR